MNLFKSKPKKKKLTLNWTNILAGILAILLLLNLVIMFIFTTTVGNKLTEALEMVKPQPGTLTLITPESCDECTNLEALKTYISNQNIELLEEQTYTHESPEAQKLISDYEIENLPALVFESDEKLKSQIKKSLKKGSRQVGENVLVWEQVQAPYFDVKTGKIAGLVDITFLTDKSCTECYDVVNTQKGSLRPFGIYFANENKVDISSAEGKELIEKYNIESVPNIILSSDADAYENLKTIWDQIGSIEEDGSFVFRKVEVLKGKYKDLTTGKILGAN